MTGRLRRSRPPDCLRHHYRLTPKISVEADNALASHLDAQQATAPWASEAIGDARVTPEALGHVITQRFGERAVIATPNDPIANANAEAMGCEIIHGGSLSADAWANIRKHAIVPTTAQAFPTPKPAAVGAPVKICPLCKQPIRQ